MWWITELRPHWIFVGSCCLDIGQHSLNILWTLLFQYKQPFDWLLWTPAASSYFQRRVTLNGNSLDTTKNVKAKIQEDEGVPASLQRLIFAGKHLEENKTLSMSQITEYLTLHSILRLRGGVLLFANVNNVEITLIDSIIQIEDKVSVLCGVEQNPYPMMYDGRRFGKWNIYLELQYNFPRVILYALKVEFKNSRKTVSIRQVQAAEQMIEAIKSRIHKKLAHKTNTIIIEIRKFLTSLIPDNVCSSIPNKY